MEKSVFVQVKDLPTEKRHAAELLLGTALEEDELLFVRTSTASDQAFQQLHAWFRDDVGAGGSHGLSGPEKAKAFRAWAEGFPASATPPLSPEAVSRENIYKRD